MPGYYSRQQPVTGQMPITPPDSGSGYGYANMHYSQDPYASHQHLSQCRHDPTYDYQQQQAYMQPPVAPAPPTYQYQQSSYQSSSTLPPIQGYYEPIGAPILPPLRINERAAFGGDDYQRRIQQEQQNAVVREQQRQVAAKEEKATGGVSATLDYDMDRMTDFVTEATQSIFQSQMRSHPSFRKWVHQVLSATRLPSATILLSLHYLNDRLVRFPESVTAGENQIYRLLAVSLILGSKFLDDNTFINRSWSDVTAIKVTELNILEMEWFKLISWRLHVDHEAPDGFKAWKAAWDKFDYERVIKNQPARLAPLDTNVHRHANTGRDRYSPYPTPQTATASYSRPFESTLSARASQFSTSFSATDPWAPTNHRPADDYYKRQEHYPSPYELEEASRRATEERALHSQSAFSYAQNTQSAHPSYYQTHTPTYGSGWDSAAWSGVHGYDCNCNSCRYQQHYRPYPMSSTYAPQPVMG